MSLTPTQNPAEDEAHFLYDSAARASGPSDWDQSDHLSAMNNALELFAWEVADELAAIRSILGVPPEIDNTPASPSAAWSPPRTGNADVCISADDVAKGSEAGLAAESGEKAHDRIAALKERLAEKLRDETGRHPTNSSGCDSTFATKMGQNS